MSSEANTDDEQFKAFHRMLCERFGYGHDDKDWKRDQVSLMEHIAKQIQVPPEPVMVLFPLLTNGEDRELDVMHIIAQAFRQLDGDQISHVLEYLLKRYTRA